MKNCGLTLILVKTRLEVDKVSLFVTLQAVIIKTSLALKSGHLLSQKGL